jgi:peptidoglycan/LPS O-acetylase OafA/YrhL
VLVLGSTYLLYTYFERAFDLVPAVLVTVSAYGLIKSNHVAWFFTRRPVNWLGYISYSVFLLHGIVITVSVIVMRRLHISWELSNYWAIVGGMGFVVVLTSTMTLQVIERRFWR